MVYIGKYKGYCENGLYVMEDMTDPVDPDDLSAEEEYEMKAAFGEDAVDNGEIVRIDTDKLEPVPEKKWEMAEVLSEGDYMEYETRSGKVICGTVTNVKDYAVEFDRDEEKCGVGSGYVSFDSFGGERGTMLELLTVNGEEVDVDYEPRVVD